MRTNKGLSWAGITWRGSCFSYNGQVYFQDVIAEGEGYAYCCFEVLEGLFFFSNEAPSTPCWREKALRKEVLHLLCPL